MSRRSTKRFGTMIGGHGGRPPTGAAPSRGRGLAPVSGLPAKAKLFLAAAGLAITGLVAWMAVRLLDTDSRPLAIVLIVLTVIGAVVVGFAVVTATRMLFSLRAVPYLLGRGMRRLLARR